MWDLRIANPFGRLSTRKFFTFVTTMLVATFASTLLLAPTTHAADANWNGTSITYNTNQYIASADAKSGDSRGLTQGTKIYAYVETPQTGSTVEKAHFIYFTPPADPTTATSAQYITYDFTPPNTFTNPTSTTSISLTPQNSSTSSSPGTTSCDSTFTFGIGWIICPITNFLSGAMDWLFSILSGFLTVRPVQMTQDNALYRAWSFMRNFANIAFVVGFLVIIYSQITNIGLSNYGVKRILPRIIIAAILVNVSYLICALAIDVSNILGYSIQSIFIALRNGLVGGEGNGWDVTSWKSVSGFILSGGTATAAAGIGTYALLAGTVGGAIYLLLPILVGTLMAVLAALLVMAARQAIITIMVILAPLAFVAYLLPNTEKYFDKWKDLFLTMLIMFPAFSVIFGGAQLAGVAIIQNADSINLIILGMAVQVAPLAITPLLLRFSGTLLGKVAGMANNPKRGAVDRTRNWSKERANQHKARVMANAGPRRRDVLGRTARAIDTRRRAREGWHKANEAINDNNFHGSSAYHAIDQANREIDRTKRLIESQHDIDWNVRIRTDKSQLEKELRVRTTADQANLTKEQMDMTYREIQAGDRSYLRSFNYSADPGLKTTMFSVAHRAQRTAEEVAYTGIAKTIADKKLQDNVSDALLDNRRTVDGKTLREYAGGIGGIQGQNTALASAVTTKRKQYIDTIGEMEQLMKHFNPSSESLQALVTTGTAAVGHDSKGRSFTFTADNNYAMEAAVDKQVSIGTVQMVDDIIALSGSSLAEYRTTISESLAKAGHTGRSIYQGGSLINEVAKGTIKSQSDLTKFVQKTIADGKFSAAQLATIDEGALARILAAASSPALDPAKAVALADGIAILKRKADDALTDPMIKNSVKKNATPILESIRNL
jgi:hypothetical protein